MSAKNEHYFSSEPVSKSRPNEIEFEYRDIHYRFKTDAGVFSRERVDYGSQQLLLALPALSGRVLDLGCGCGAVGICAASANPSCEIVMCDINSRAAALAAENIALNRIKNASALVSDGFAKLDGLFSAILTNPPIRAGKSTIYSLFRASFEHLENEGKLYVVINKNQGAPSAMKELRSYFSSVEVISKSAGFWVLEASK